MHLKKLEYIRVDLDLRTVDLDWTVTRLDQRCQPGNCENREISREK